MKKTLLYIAPLALAAAALAACDNEFERPPMVMPSASWQPTATIEEVKAEYWSSVESGAKTVGLTADGDSVIVKGRVCSSDQSGNIFKYLFIQGESEALALTLDFYDIYQSYKYGQEVMVNLTGLTIGGYSGLMCVGSGTDSNGRVARAAEATFAAHAQTNGLPNVSKLDTISTSIGVVDAAKSTIEGLQQWQSQLVRIDNVYFENAGEPFAVGTNSNSRYVIDPEGNRLNVYNSTYADFKDDILPSGTGSVVGILSYFGSNWQLLLIDAQGCIGFNGVSAPRFSPAPGAVAPGTAISLSTPTEGATIHYTLDGEDPTPKSEVYTTPIVINQSTVIKAIAVKDDAKTSTVAIGSFTVTDSAPTTGNGTEASPYSVDQVIALNPTSTQEALQKDAWASGYIVGYIPTGSSTIIGNTVFGTQGDVAASNIVIAASPEITDYNECIAIQLPSATDIRAALNLKDNPGNIGKQLLVKGDIMKYCGAPGIKNPTEASLDGEKIGAHEPVTPPDNTSVAFSESFTNGNFGLFSTITDTKGQWEGWRANTSTPTCAIANSYVDGKNEEGTSSLISPTINLKAYKTAYVKFEQAYGFYFPTSQERFCNVKVRGGNNGEWKIIPMLTFPAKKPTGNWTDFETTILDVSEYAGGDFEVRFDYENDGIQSIAWEIRNLEVYGTK